MKIPFRLTLALFAGLFLLLFEVADLSAQPPVPQPAPAPQPPIQKKVQKKNKNPPPLPMEEENKEPDSQPILIQGELRDEDPRDAVKKDCAHKVHVVKLLASRTYQIDMMWKDEKRAMDPFLRIEDSGKKQLADDDDSGGDYNPRIYFTPPVDGDYRIVATSLYGTGKYAVRVAAVPKIPVVKGMVKFEDRIVATDPRDEARPGCYCKVFKVNMIKGKTYTIDMVSGQLDSYLRLEDNKKNRIAEDDDSGGFPNARIVFHPQETGTYRVIATTFAPDTLGAFTVTVRDE